MALLGWENAIDDAAVSLAASDAADGYSVESLRVPIGPPSVAWQTPAGVTSASLTITSPASIDWRAACLARTNLTTSATIRVQAGSYDSGTISAGVAVGIRQALHVLPADEAALSMVITIADAANPDGYLNIPLVYAGPGTEFNIAPNSDDGLDARNGDTVTRGGTVIAEALSAARAWNIQVGFIRDTETWIPPLQATAAARRNILFVPRLNYARASSEAVFGLLAPGRRGFLGPTGAYRTWAATISERL